MPSPSYCATYLRNSGLHGEGMAEGETAVIFRLIVVAAALAVTSVPVVQAQDTDEVFLTTVDDGGKFYLLPSTLRNGSAYGTPYKDIWATVRYANGNATRNLSRYWCADRKVTIMAAIEYDKNGRQMDTEQEPEATARMNAMHIVPKSLADIVASAICQ